MQVFPINRLPINPIHLIYPFNPLLRCSNKHHWLVSLLKITILRKSSSNSFELTIC